MLFRSQALPSRLAALPVAIPVPERRVEPPAPAPSLLRRALPWLGWAVAAGALFSAFEPAPTRVLVAGTEVVQGETDVLAGDTRVHVDGKARITVEPPGGRGRGVAAEDLPMDRTHLLSALAGSVVTVAVLEGTAELRAEAAPPVHVEAGETRTIGKPQEPTAKRPKKGAPTDDVASLKAELEKARFEKALAVGQLRRREGVAQGRARLYAVGIAPSPIDAGVQKRMKARAMAAMEDLSAEITGEE